MENQQIYQKELNQTNFLKDKAFKIASGQKYDDYQRVVLFDNGLQVF